ncbi:helix-turn-helix domain-containing protein [Cohnella herbarum]|uniref:AraC family transcriptional regulator n=1 Tax=Cohnella herbarum TaxID=2728023 RepID=A0A7Z2VKM0_9BACL|nr:AraC family transcriptional regulator [Cohnella herbarum]QJD84614.1 AraC family transcriptional regulator [Cohnella herbarum]
MVQIPFNKSQADLFKDGQSPILLYAGQISNDPSWSFPPHKHDDLCEILYVSEGEGLFVIDNITYTASKGDILVYNGGVLHEERSNPDHPLKTYFCGVGQLRIEGLRDHYLFSPGIRPVIPTGPYSHQVEGYISTLFEELKSQVFGFEIVCQNVLVSLIVSVLRILNSQSEAAPASSPSLGLLIKEYIDINYTRDIPLNEIANRLYISPFYLSHIFKEETGTSPINYLIQRRIGEAKKLLLTTRMPIQEITETVGYSNANYFSTLFKKVTGQSPSQFRKSEAN